MKCSLSVKTMALWLELNKECAAPNVWSELTFELVYDETLDHKKADKFADIAFQLGNELAEDMIARLEANGQ